MSALPLIEECHDKGINIRVEGSEIVLSAPKGVLTPELVARVKKEKPALLASLGRTIVFSAEDWDRCLRYVPGGQNSAPRPVTCVDMLARRLWRYHNGALQAAAGDAWALISFEPDGIFSFALAEATRQILKAGRMPDTFTEVTNCLNCGLVPISPGQPDRVDECAWCMSGQTPPPKPGVEK